MVSPKSRRRYRIALILVVAACSFGSYPLVFSSSVKTATASFSWHRGGALFIFHCTVCFEDGTPSPGTAIAFRSSSGWTSEAITDQVGNARVFSGESEVLAIRVNGNVLKEWSSDLWFLCPSVSDGLFFHIVLKGKAKWMTASLNSDS